MSVCLFVGFFVFHKLLAFFRGDRLPAIGQRSEMPFSLRITLMDSNLTNMLGKCRDLLRESYMLTAETSHKKWPTAYKSRESDHHSVALFLVASPNDLRISRKI